MTNNEKILTLDEAAKLLKFSNRTLYHMVKTGQVPCKKLKHQWRFHVDQLEAWIKSSNHDIAPWGSESNANFNILIVDDEQSTLDSMVSNLRDAFREAEVRTCKDGVDALIEIGSFKPDVLILDINLPRMDGVQICKALKANATTKNVFIITITGFIDEDTRNKARDAGCDIYVQKPFKTQDIIDVIKRHIEARKEPVQM